MIRRYRHAQLLFMLAVLLLADPFLPETVANAVVDLILPLTLVSAVIACADRRHWTVVGVVLAVLVMAASTYRDFSGIESVTILHSGLVLCFFAYVTTLVLASVFRDSEAASADTIFGALAAYLLIGIGWAFAYALLDAVAPGSISGLRAETQGNSYQPYVGFSFVTLTTLGYGSVVPVTARAEALAIAEAIVGPVYLTVLVARLVALNLKSGEGTGSDREQPG